MSGTRARVVASVGTDHHRFDRMLEWIGDAAQQLDLDVFVQRGATPAREGVPGVDYTAADELGRLMAAADYVVCHGGPGTISLARSNGHKPIVIARDPARDEHVDDHQMRYVAKLTAEGQIDSTQSFDELLGLLAAPRPRLEVADTDPAADAVREFGSLVAKLAAGELPRRSWRQRLQLRREQ